MTENTGDVRFGRSAFGGFDRKDVMDYIDKLQRAAAEKCGDPDALREQLAQAEQARDALAAENRQLREQILQLQAHLKVEQTTNELLGEKLHAPTPDETAAVPDDTFCATDEPVNDADAKTLSMRDVDEMVQKYFG